MFFFSDIFLILITTFNWTVFYLSGQLCVLYARLSSFGSGVSTCISSCSCFHYPEAICRSDVGRIAIVVLFWVVRTFSLAVVKIWPCFAGFCLFLVTKLIFNAVFFSTAGAFSRFISLILCKP